MKRQPLRGLVLTALLVFSSITFADDSKVIDWTTHVILSTLTTNDTTLEAKDNPACNHYTANAWNAISTFLGQHLDIARKNNVVLHPVVLGPSKIVDAGVIDNSHFFSGFRYWRIKQSFSIPELNLDIDFSTVVISAHPNHEKYMIQSIDMVKRE